MKSTTKYVSDDAWLLALSTLTSSIVSEYLGRYISQAALSNAMDQAEHALRAKNFAPESE